MPRQKRNTNAANMPICTHLSNQILPSQFSCGKAEPGSVSKTVEINSQPRAGRKEVKPFFTSKFSAMIKFFSPRRTGEKEFRREKLTAKTQGRKALILCILCEVLAALRKSLCRKFFFVGSLTAKRQSFLCASLCLCGTYIRKQ